MTAKLQGADPAAGSVGLAWKTPEEYESTVKAQGKRLTQMKAVGDTLLADYRAAGLHLTKLEAALREIINEVLTQVPHDCGLIPQRVRRQAMDARAALTPTELQEGTRK